MTSIRRTIALGFAAAFTLAAQPATAQFRSWNVCGGTVFATCSSVQVVLVGSSVTLRIWNLSGFYGASGNTVLTGVGFDNVGTAAGVAGSLTMSGPVRSGDSPLQWILNNDAGGGFSIDLVASSSGVDNGIGEACTAGPAGVDIWQNPCALPSGESDPGWVVLSFSITGTWNLDSTFATIHGNNGGQESNCFTGGPNFNCPTVPEPITIALLGTGLAGLGGAGFLRRRRRPHDNDIES